MKNRERNLNKRISHNCLPLIKVFPFIKNTSVQIFSDFFFVIMMWRALWFFQLLIVVCLSGVIDNELSQKTIRGGRISGLTKIESVKWVYNLLLIPSGGTEASRNQFPYQVAFFVYTRDGQSICGGSVLSSTWLLSAAHCFIDFQSADALAGIHNILQDDPVYELEVFPSDVVMHAQYNRVTQLNDIAAIRTSKRPIVFSSAIQPITMIARSMANTDLTNTNGRIAGWWVRNFERFVFLKKSSKFIWNFNLNFKGDELMTIPKTFLQDYCSSMRQLLATVCFVEFLVFSKKKNSYLQLTVQELTEVW